MKTTWLSVFVVSSMLTACGGSGSSNSGSATDSTKNDTSKQTQTTSEPKPKTIEFARFIYNSKGLNRDNVTITGDVYKLTQVNLKKESSSGQTQTKPEPYYIFADNFFKTTNRALPESYEYDADAKAEVLNDTTYNISIADDSGKSFIAQKVELTPVDISNTNKTNKKVITDITDMKTAPESLTFPEGSVCYKRVEKHSKGTYQTLGNKGVSDTTIAQWKQENIANGEVKKDAVFTDQKVGVDNANSASFSQQRYDEHISVVNYNGKLYYTWYTTSGVVDYPDYFQKFCKSYNKVAADFVEKAIKTYGYSK